MCRRIWAVSVPFRCRCSNGQLGAQKKGETKLDKFVIHGGHRLTGEIEVSGAKNAAVALIPAVLLSDEPCVLENVPDISDVSISLQIMSEMGATVEYLTKTTVRISAAGLTNYCVPYESARKMRASYYFLGALLGRYGKARVSMPGGCPLGDRPIDQHLKAFAALGAKCNIEHGMVDLVADQLTGNQIYLDVVSVGATMNAMLAAVLAEGVTTIYNAACEPYLQQLCRMLNRMGARISGIASNLLTIEGVEELHGTQHTVLPDMIEVGSFIGMAAMTKSEITIKNVSYENLGIIPESFRRLGIKLEQRGDDIYVPAQEVYEIESFIDGSIMTIADAPWPGLTPDLLSVMLVVATQAKGSVLIHQKMFESRLFFVDKLIDMGAQIILCDPHRAVVIGHNHGFKLRGARLTSPDIRAGIALLIAAMSAEGTSTISNIEQIDRGYQNIEGRLNAIGARITRI